MSCHVWTRSQTALFLFKRIVVGLGCLSGVIFRVFTARRPGAVEGQWLVTRLSFSGDAASRVAVEAISAMLMTYRMLLRAVSICRRDDGGERE